MLGLNAHDAALLIEFARCSALRAQLLAYDLGPRTRAAQAEAVCKRLLLDAAATGETAEQAALTRLPAHCTCIFVCSECRRIANACQDGTGKPLPFNELGISASMLRIDGGVLDGHMRCAKRSSAALRTAVTLEEMADELEVESAAVREDAQLPVDLRPASEVAKLRRDIKNCYEQRDRAVACGDVPLVRIPVLGRAVRIFGEWYALCAQCGCLTRVSPGSRVRAEPCCMKCDFAMLHGKEAAREAIATLPKPPPPSCRFCGKQQSEHGTSRWKMIQAPADTGGRNATVPPPLRVCWYCALAHLIHRSRALPFLTILTTRSDALPLVARQRAQGNAHGGHLCAHHGAGEAHVWCRQEPRRAPRADGPTPAIGQQRRPRGCRRVSTQAAAVARQGKHSKALQR